jgi:hypothetical protein
LFDPAALVTTDGRRVVVLDPGRRNTDGGPDCTGALVRIGTTLYRGDVELHVHADGWTAHGHHRDPHYERVILHVAAHPGRSAVAARTRLGRPVPLLLISSVTDLPSHRIADPPGCAECVALLPPRPLRAHLLRAGLARVNRRVHTFEGRLQELADEELLCVRDRRRVFLGAPDDLPLPTFRPAFTVRKASRPVWDQLLYEAVFEAMGFSKNAPACRQLSRNVRLRTLQRFGLANTPAMLAIVLGAAGLLPSSRGLPDLEGRRYVRFLRRQWKEARPSLRIPLLHEGDWLFFRLRPVNFPTARLAAMALLLPQVFDDEGMRWFVRLFRRDPFSSVDAWKEMAGRCAITPDGYWTHRVHFRGGAAGSGVRLGTGRLREIVVNAVLPAMLLYARTFAEAVVRRNVHRVLLDLAAGPPPSRIRACVRLFGNRAGRRSVLLEQGMLEVSRQCAAREGW